MYNEGPGARLRELRRRRGLTQEELAEAAVLSVQCIKKIEQGGSARMETYRQIAKVLGVTTVSLITPGAPEPVEETGNEAALADIRSVITPPVDMDGFPLYGIADWDDVSLPRLRDAANAAAMAYHSDRYDHLARVLPALIRSAHFHVARFDGKGDDGQEALRLRADMLGVAGRYLIQVRVHDLAMVALQQAIQDARKIDDIPLIASSVSLQGWAMLRQGRFDEVERLCAQAAQEIEPRLSQAKPHELAAWGWLLIRAASAAVRNNRTAEAYEYLALADTAGARIGVERRDFPGHRSFGPVSVALMRAEVAMIEDEPAQTLRVMDNLPPEAGRPHASTWNRGQIEKARALVAVGDANRAAEILQELKAKSPEWLRYQQRARDTTLAILKAQTRMPNAQQRELADFLEIEE